MRVPVISVLGKLMQEDCCEFQSELQSDPVTQGTKTTERERECEQERYAVDGGERGGEGQGEPSRSLRKPESPMGSLQSCS